MGSKYLVDPNELLGVIGEAPLPLPLGHAEEINMSCIGIKC